MNARPLPISPRSRETLLTLSATVTVAALLAGTMAGCSGGGGGGGGTGTPQIPEQTGPIVDAGSAFPIASSRLDAVTYALRPGEPIPPEAMRLINARSEASPEPLRTSLAARGFLGALMTDTDLAELERMLISKAITVPIAPPPPPPPPPPTLAPSPAPSLSPGTSIIGGTASGSVSEPAPQPAPIATAVGSAVGGVSSLAIRPSAPWTPLIDATPRTEPWALSLGSSVASLKPGTLRCFVRNWPAPAEPIPTAGMAAELRVQILPVMTGPAYEVAPDPLAPPPLSTDLSARGQVLSRQAFTTGLRGGTALVLIALPAPAPSSGPGPQAEAAPMLGQALLGSAPASTPLGPASGPRVLVLKAIVPGTYRLMLDRPTGAGAAAEQPR